MSNNVDKPKISLNVSKDIKVLSNKFELIVTIYGKEKTKLEASEKCNKLVGEVKDSVGILFDKTVLEAVSISPIVEMVQTIVGKKQKVTGYSYSTSIKYRDNFNKELMEKAVVALSACSDEISFTLNHLFSNSEVVKQQAIKELLKLGQEEAKSQLEALGARLGMPLYVSTSVNFANYDAPVKMLRKTATNSVSEETLDISNLVNFEPKEKSIMVSANLEFEILE